VRVGGAGHSVRVGGAGQSVRGCALFYRKKRLRTGYDAERSKPR